MEVWRDVAACAYYIQSVSCGRLLGNTDAVYFLRMIGVPCLQSQIARFAGVGLLLRGLPRGLRAARTEIAAADRVVVHKSEHKLYLYSGSRLLGRLPGRSWA